MQIGGIGNSFGALNTGLGTGGLGGVADTSFATAASDNSGDIYASVYQSGEDYMMDDGLDIYA